MRCNQEVAWHPAMLPPIQCRIQCSSTTAPIKVTLLCIDHQLLVMLTSEMKCVACMHEVQRVPVFQVPSIPLLRSQHTVITEQRFFSKLVLLC